MRFAIPARLIIYYLEALSSLLHSLVPLAHFTLQLSHCLHVAHLYLLHLFLHLFLSHGLHYFCQLAIVTCIEESAKSMTYDGAYVGQ